MNNTFYYTADTVTKVFRDRICFDHEKKIYELLNHTGLGPDLLRAEKQTIVLERINGQTFAQITETCTDLSAEIHRVCQWYSALLDKLHELCGKWIVLDDLNPKNILVTPECVLGIDFEEYHAGSCTEACAVLCEVLASMYIPEKDAHVQEAVSFLAEKYSLPAKELLEECSIQIQKNENRRSAMNLIRNSTAVILAGGKARRMNHVPKGLLKLGDYTFMDHILHTLQVFDDLRISANDDAYAEYDYPVIHDRIPGLGPLGALSSVLTETDEEYVFLVPCDTPLLKRETICRCYQMMDDHTDAVVLKAADGIYPTIGVYRTSALSAVNAQIQSGDYWMLRLLDTLRTKYLYLDHAQDIRNVNTPEDYLEIQKQ